MSMNTLRSTAGRALSQTPCRALHYPSSTFLPQQPPYQPSTLPPTYLLPLRAYLITTTTSTTTTDPTPPESAYNKHPTTSTPTYSTPSPSPHIHPPRLPPRLALSKHTPLPPPTNLNLSLLPLLAAQPPHYIQASLHSRPYLLTLGDTLRLPFHMPNAPPGTILRLNRVSTIGSRDYTFRGGPWVDEGVYVLRARVVGVEGEPMRVVEKTKRRQRRVKTVRSKMRFTVLRICELRVCPEGNGEEGEARERVQEGEAVLEEDARK